MTRFLFLLFVFLVCLLVMLFFMSLPNRRVYAREGDDHGNHGPLKPWFDSLRSQRGMCCSFADGVSIEDVDWDVTDGHYRVRLSGQWIVVPDDALVTESNRFGPAVVWPWTDAYGTHIRCFMPGAGT